MKRSFLIFSGLLLASAAFANADDANRAGGQPSGRSQPGAKSDRPSSIGDPKDGGVASNNAYGRSTGVTGGTYHGKKAGPVPRPHDAPMPGNAAGNTGK